MAGVKGKSGGPRKGSGRKSKAEEQNLVEKLSPMEDSAHSALEIAVKAGEPWAIKLFFEYMYGKPLQRTDVTSNGETVNIPVISWVDDDSDE